MKAKIESKGIIEAYERGESLNAIARAFSTYPTSIRRILIRNGIKLRHDTLEKGVPLVTGGEELIEWAKAQGRLVTKNELAKIMGKSRLSPSYFLKYPELGQYIAVRKHKELQDYSCKLYKWLKENNIPYKPNDRTTLGLCIDALLMGDYKGIGIQLNIKPSDVSKKQFTEDMKKKVDKAERVGLIVILLDEKRFENLDSVRDLINSIKNSREK